MKSNKNKTALVTGITGQDGSYLAEFLLEKNYNVVGIVRKTSNVKYDNIGHIQKDLNLVYGDLMDHVNLGEIVQKYKPNEIYNLASQSAPADSFKQPIHTAEITGLAAHRLLEVVRSISPKSKFYQASSSEMFGWVKEIPQNEETPFNPANPYAAAKLYAHNMAKIYRESYGMFIATGILFNHESPRRNMCFVTQKVTYAAACIKSGLTTSPFLNEAGEPIVNKGKVYLGNLEAKRDWGYAGDFVHAMWLILQHEIPDDFIISTGETHSVAQLCQEAFSSVGLDWKQYVKTDPRFVRPTETGPLVGDYSKAKRILKWKPEYKFPKLIKLMVDAHLERF